MGALWLALLLLLAARGATALPPPPLPHSHGAPLFPPPSVIAARAGGNASTATPAARVIGGDPVGWAAEAGIHAKITINGNSHFICGGSLLTHRHVLTAAHCVAVEGVAPPPSSYHVRLGGADVDHGLVRAVAAIAIHPEYAIGRSSHADVAVLTLDRGVYADEAAAHHLRMVTLNPNPTKPVAGTTAIMTGWGHSTEGGGGTVDKLLRVRLLFLSHAQCLRVHTGGGMSLQATALAPPPEAVDEKEELCTGGLGKRSCTGVSWRSRLCYSLRGGVLF